MKFALSEQETGELTLQLKHARKQLERLRLLCGDVGNITDGQVATVQSSDNVRFHCTFVARFAASPPDVAERPTVPDDGPLVATHVGLGGIAVELQGKSDAGALDVHTLEAISQYARKDDGTFVFTSRERDGKGARTCVLKTHPIVCASLAAAFDAAIACKLAS